jgi:electron transport complex protein RnfB
MSEQIYIKLRQVLDTLPNGFPETESGVELKILKTIFTPEDAELFCDLRLSFETPEQISQRSGRPIEGLDDHLKVMWKKGQVFGIDFGEVRVYRMIPWVFGIFEFQLKHMTKELAQLCRDYEEAFGTQFFNGDVPMMNIVPVEEGISSDEATMPFEQVSAIIERCKSFAVNDCVCKKEHELLGEPCDRPMEVCLAIAPVEGVFENHPLGARPISKQEAYDILKLSEEAGLVHMVSNTEQGHYFICNCCSCCCGVLKGVNKYAGAKGVNSNYYAVIDEEECISCGVCADERCQVFAIEENDDAYTILQDKCIGCGLCISTCPSEAISLIRKNVEDIALPPVDEQDWYAKRGKARGVDYSKYA